MPEFHALTLAGGSFTHQQRCFRVDRLPPKDPSYLGYALMLEQQQIGQATCQSASLIQANLAQAGTAALSVEPLLVRLYSGQCHWIETLQILPPFRGQGYGSLWLEALCALLRSEAKLPIALHSDAWWDDSSPLDGQQLENWYERHRFLKFPGTDGLFTLRVRDDPQRSATNALVQQLIAELAADLTGMATKMADSEGN